MKIGLIDVDGHNGYPNLAIMKLSTYHKQKGDYVEWYDGLFGGGYDIVYMSKVFTHTEDYLYPINAHQIIKGGTGYDMHSKLPQDIDMLQPDYSLYPIVDEKTSYGFLTRGCPNKCRWCIVPKKEGNIQPYMDIEDITQNGARPNAVLMDNNVLACEYGIKQIEKIVGRGYRIDFNQGLDARLVTPKIAEMFANVKWQKYIRFGCDTPKQVEECDKVISMIQEYGYTGSFMLYTMIYGDINECLNRIGRWKAPQYEGKVKTHSQPELNFGTTHQNIPQWQKDMAHWANKKTCYFGVDFKDFSPRKGFTCGEYFKKS